MTFYFPASMIIEENTSYTFPAGMLELRLCKAENKAPGEGFGKLKLFRGSSPLISSICLSDIMAQLTSPVETTHLFIFNYSYLTLPPTNCVPGNFHDPNTGIQQSWSPLSDILLFLILMEKGSLFIPRDVLI